VNIIAAYPDASNAVTLHSIVPVILIFVDAVVALDP